MIAASWGDAGRQSVRSTFPVTPERHPTPGDRAEVPSTRIWRRGVPIDQRHRHARLKHGVLREELVVTDRLYRLLSLEAPLTVSPRECGRGIVIRTDEGAEMQEHVVVPDIVR